MSSQKRHAVVTGSASGIGRSIAYHLQTDGWIVTGIDIRPSEYSDIEIQADLTDWEQLETKLAGAVGNSPIDALVNCAGVQIDRGPSTKLDIMSLDLLYAHNLRPVVQMVNWALPLLAPQASIVNIGSISGAKTVPGLAPYGAMKAAMHSYSQSLAAELGPQGFRVNVVAPGYVETPLTSEMMQNESRLQQIQQSIPLRRITTPAEVAEAVMFLVSEQAEYITGTVLPVDGGYLA